jgi:hypothetical protein
MPCCIKNGREDAIRKQILLGVSQFTFQSFVRGSRKFVLFLNKLKSCVEADSSLRNGGTF